ncbi:MAG TPA: UvrD-helicase domain-containing protein, partial [Candidatus Saccharimonadales bacterium]|nr:UvrD-helicase domain-containing protein [Candidatus Saccharimonadales bacterium]
MLDDLKARLAKVKDFFDDEKSFTDVDAVELPDLSNYQEPQVPAGLQQKINSLQSSIKHVEEIAQKARPADFDERKNYRIDYRNRLNEAQFRAVTKTKGPMLVIAGAGSGKTRVIVYRVSFLLENNVPPDRILLLTFTRKAAGEMLERVSKLTKSQLSSRVVGGTFHSFASMILRRYGKLVGIDANFTIADASDSADAINIVRTQLGIKKTKDS